jgi:hypothetical protein
LPGLNRIDKNGGKAGQRRHRNCYTLHRDHFILAAFA